MLIKQGEFYMRILSLFVVMTTSFFIIDDANAKWSNSKCSAYK